MPNNEYDDLVAPKPLQVPGAQDGGYDALLADDRAQLKQQLQQSFSLGTKAVPDTRAKALRLGQQTGLPAPVVERNLPKVEQQAARPNEYDAILNNNPRLADWLAASPDNVAVAQDDLDNLGAHEKAIAEHGWTRTLWNSVNSMSTHLGSTLTRLPATAVNVLNAGVYGAYNALVPESMEVDPRRYTFRTENAASRYYDAQTKAWNIKAMDADMVDAYEMVKRGNISSAAKVATSQLISSVLPSMLVAGAATAAGQPGLGLTAMGAMSGADAYQQAEQKGVSPGAAASHAVTSGSLEVLTESLSFGTMGWMKNVVESVGKRFGKQAAVQFAKETALEITKAMGGEAVEELAAEAGQAASEYLNGVNPQAFDNFGRRMFNAGVLGALGGGVGAGATSVGVGTAKLIEHAQQRAQANADKALYLELGKLAEGSKVRQRGTDLHQQALLALAGDSQVKDVYVPVEMFQNAPWQDATAADMAARLGVAEEFNLAVETGGDVKVPLAMWVDKVVGTPAYQELASDIKFDPNGLTLNQVAVQQIALEAEMDAEAKAAQEPAQAEPAAPAPEAQVEQAIRDQLTQAGRFTPDEVNKYAQVYREAFRVFAAESGVDAMELFKRYGLQVNPGAPAVEGASAADPMAPAQYTPTPLEQELGIKPLKGLSQHELESYQRFVQKAASADIVAQYATLADSEGGKVIDTDVARELHEDYSASEVGRTVFTPATQTVATYVANKAFDAKLAEPVNGPAMFLAGGGGSGKGTTTRGLLAESKAGADVVFDGTLANAEKASVLIDKALATGRPVLINYIHRPILDAARGVAQRFFKEGGGRPVPYDIMVEDHVNAQKSIVALAEKYAEHPGVFIQFVDNSGKTPKLITLDDFKALSYSQQGEGTKETVARLLAEVRALKEVQDAEQEVTKRRTEFAQQFAQQRRGLDQQGADGEVQGLEGRGDQGRPAGPERGGQEAQALNQDPDGARGRLSIGPNRAMRIDLLEKADRSTFLHETGHFFLEVLRDLALASDANPELKARLDATVEWLGLENIDQLTLDGKAKDSPEYNRAVEAHEKFARGFEAYLMEGKAPTPRLRKVFAAFRVWLTAIYKRLAALNVELTPSARALFDRFLATEQEIAQAQATTPPLFTDPIAAGFSEAKAKAYLEAIEEARLAAEEKVLASLLKDLNQAQTEAWKAQREQVEAEMRERFAKVRIYNTISILTEGKTLDGKAVEPIKIDRASVPSDKRRGLPKGILVDEGGLHADVAASMLGYDSGAALLMQVREAVPFERAVKQATDLRMQELKPDLFTSGDLPEEAKKAVHDEKRAQVLRLELEHLAANNLPALKEGIRRVARRVPTEAAVRRQAERIIGGRKVNELKPHLFERAEAKAAKAAGEALAKGDFAAAFDAKQKELLNHELYRAAVKAQENVDAALERFKKLGRTDEQLSKTRDMALVNAARAVLASFGIGKSDKPAGAYLEGMRKYELDEDVVETVEALIGAATEKAADYRTVAYDDFASMADSVDALWSLAQSTRQIEIDGKMMDRQEVMGELAGRLDEILPEAKSGYQRAATPGDRVIRGLMGARAALRRVEAWVDAVDGLTTQGAFRRYIWNPVKEGADRFRTAKKQVLEKYLDIVKQVEPTLNREDITAPELNYVFSGKQELLGALLHRGNLSNLTKLLRGRGWGQLDEEGNLDRRRWDAFEARMQREGILTKADYDYAQAVWDLLEETKADAQRAHKRMYGHYFNEVTADGFTTPYGSYRGGYMPAIADSFLAQDAAIRAEKEQLEKSNNSYMFPTAGRGFTKSRVDAYAAPLTLDLAMVPAHLDKVLRFIHIEPAVKDVSRLVMDRDFRKTLDAFDPTVGGDMLVPWLQRAAQQRISQPSKGWAGKAADTFFREVRTRTGLQVMTANVLNALQQVTGLSMSAVKVKPRHLANALWTYVRAPKQTAEEVAEKSIAMRNDMAASAMQVQQTIDELLLNPTKYEQAREFAKKHGYFMQTGTQNVVNVVTWTAAYNQAIEEGANEADAVRQGDSAVRETQGTQNPEDLSRFETGTPFMRAFTMFYSYFNMQANLLGTEFTKVARDMGLRKGAGRGLYVYALGFMIPALLAEGIVRAGHGDDGDGDDDYMDEVLSLFFGSQFRSLTGMAPIVGPAVNAGVNAFNDKWYDDRISTSPAVAMVESAVSAPHSVYKAVTDGGSKKRAIRDTLTALGLLTGLPLAPLGRPAGYLADVSEGQAPADNAVDVVRGLVTGKAATQ